MGDVVRLPDSDRDGRQSLGVTLYMVVSSLTFATLLFMFVLLRSERAPWPPEGASSPPGWLVLAPTIFVAGVLASLRAGVRNLLEARLASLKRQLSWALALAGGFAVAGSALWTFLTLQEYRVGSPPGAIVFMLFAWLAAHGVLGIATLAFVRRGVRTGRYHARNSVHVRFVARLWYFVAAHWAVACVSLFLM
ncbi:MAG TPA: hypothetical protein VGD74_04610 [Vulgatibacter sp.]